MTKTFERFLRSFTDDQLIAFAQARSEAQPPYWRVLQFALRLEADRRGMALDPELTGATSDTSAEPRAHAGTA